MLVTKLTHFKALGDAMRKEKPDWRLRQSLDYPTESPLSLTPLPPPPLRYHLWPSEPVASRVHVVHGPKQKTLGIPFSLAANFWRVLSARKLRAVISGVCTWSRRRSRSQCWSWSRSLSDHCILILICTFLRASGSCLALSCRDLSSPAAYVRGLQTSSLLSLSLSLFHTLSAAHYQAANGLHCCRLCKVWL